MEGYVRKLFLEKGFAFIEGSDQRDYFCHWSKVLRSSVPFRNMKEGDKVTFTFEEGEQGPKAMNVLIIRTGETNGRSDTNDLRQGQQISGGRLESRELSAGRLGDEGSPESGRSDRGTGESPSRAGTQDQGPGFNNLGQYGDAVRGNNAVGTGTATNDEAGDRPRSTERAGGREEAPEAGDLHQHLNSAEHQNEAR